MNPGALLLYVRKSTKRILNQRDGLKGVIERLLSEAQTQAANGGHRLALRTLEVLDTYFTKCRDVENDLQAYLQDDDLQTEVSGREEKPCASSAVKQQEQKSVEPGPHLPKWNFLVFSGNVLEFVAFWDQFDSGVHSRQRCLRVLMPALNVYVSCMTTSIGMFKHCVPWLPHIIRKKWETELLINGGEVNLDTLFHYLQTHVEVEESVTGDTLSDA
uniref:Uncharacterized protein n=1 Tax=Trichuris muris TaxID=70415 RepID=A0A5S6Q7R0_TRIMR